MKRLLAFAAAIGMMLPVVGLAEQPEELLERCRSGRVATTVTLSADARTSGLTLSTVEPVLSGLEILHSLSNARIDLVQDEHAFSFTFSMQDDPVLSLTLEQQDDCLLVGLLPESSPLGFRYDENEETNRVFNALQVLTSLIPPEQLFEHTALGEVLSQYEVVTVREVEVQPYPNLYADAQSCTEVTVSAELLADLMNAAMTDLNASAAGAAVLNDVADALGVSSMSGAVRLVSMMLPLFMEEDIVCHIYSDENGLCAAEASVLLTNLPDSPNIRFHLLFGRKDSAGAVTWSGSFELSGVASALSGTLYCRASDDVLGGALTVTASSGGIASDVLNAAISSTTRSNTTYSNRHTQLSVSFASMPLFSLSDDTFATVTALGADLESASTLTVGLAEPLCTLRIKSVSMMDDGFLLDASQAVFPAEANAAEWREWISSLQTGAAKSILTMFYHLPASMSGGLLQLLISLMK